jgi:hypothetical protein
MIRQLRGNTTYGPVSWYKAYPFPLFPLSETD